MRAYSSLTRKLRSRPLWQLCLFASLHWISPSKPACAAEPAPSALWGQDGKEWTPTSRLPSFAYAGYHSGRDPLPTYPVSTNVKDHGAKGDGVTDDSKAFVAALAAAKEKSAVLVPAGRYVLGDNIELTRSRVVLRGEGSAKSILVIPKPLSEIHPVADRGSKAVYAFSGGFILMKGSDHGKMLTQVTAPAKRGDQTLSLASVAGLKTGDWVRLILKDATPDHSLLKHIHGDLLNPGPETLKLNQPVDWAAQITAIEGSKIRLDRPLRLDVRPQWVPEIWSMAPTLSESGVEGLGFEFPGVPKLPHLKEAGYNAIHLTGAVDCWVRDVTVIDADNGIIVGATSRFCTIDKFTSQAVKRTGTTGHHALWAVGKTQDSLFIRFSCMTTYVHDLTVEGFACGNVFTSGTGVSINCDHHRNGPYENLFTDFDAGNPSRLFTSSGIASRGPHSGARTTFWGIRGANGKFPAIPAPKDWPLLNVIGFGDYPPSTQADGPWVEPCKGSVIPPNLWKAQAKIPQSK